MIMHIALIIRGDKCIVFVMIVEHADIVAWSNHIEDGGFGAATGSIHWQSCIVSLIS